MCGLSNADHYPLRQIDGEKQLQQQLTSYITARLRYNAVLGKDVMAAVWADMARTRTPSWITEAPRNWGTAERGKLSADQWRVVCTIHLPITLIWLWDGETGRKKAMLENFMDLVIAVRIANMRVTTSSQISAYNEHIQRYVSELQSLYPGENLRPTHHAALHIGDILERFGPVHSHSAPFFERYINFLHQININNQVG